MINAETHINDANNLVHQVNHTTKARNLADRNPSQVPSGRTVHGCATPSYRDYRCWYQGQSSIENCQSEHSEATTNLFLVVVKPPLSTPRKLEHFFCSLFYDMQCWAEADRQTDTFGLFETDPSDAVAR